ncbi:phage portal protein, lambda family [Edwardsiella tarda]|uniref:phage portal protein n=1 Tax=Edwardsiella tarda TaxID=636 RepID=UPI0003009366|nr:phage portal protein [Edwardsiella tarda]UAL55295.1 phage portal protein [Edwardsiella tarda]STD29373.1 phage portal protein, lambda family [Edwardsiella tarda]
MNLLDEVIGFLSPAWKLSRLSARYAIRAFEAVTPTGTHRARREGRSADQLVQFAGRSLREQARWLDNNHDLVIGALDKLEERIIGARGIVVEPQPLTRTGELDQPLAEQIRQAWSEWSVSPDVSGQYTRPVLERLLLRTWLRDGEVFAQLVMGAAPGLTPVAGIPFWLEALEPDYVPLDYNEPAQGIVQGIRFNAWMRPLAYRVFLHYPRGAGGLTASKQIDAARMLHLKFTRRLHQVRGVSLLSGVIMRLSGLKEYEDNELLAARIAASLGMYIQRGEGIDYDPSSYSTEMSRDLQLTPGMVFDGLRPGEKIGLIKSERPNPNLESFRMGQMRAIAAGSRSSFSSIARNYDGSYSAQRQELVEAQEGYTVLQNTFIAAISRPLYRRWLAMALASGVIRPEPYSDPETLNNAVYSGPVMPWIDPQKEANAWRVMIRGGSATESDWVRARGGTPAEVKRRRKAEVDENHKLGLVFDTDPANDKGGSPDDRHDTPSTEEQLRTRRR